MSNYLSRVLLLAVSIFFFDSISSNAQIISTIAGNGTPGYFGDGLAATVAELNQPEGLAMDAAGNLYVAEYNNNRVRKITPAGYISTFAGNGTPGYTSDFVAATATELNSPVGVAVDAAGNVYIADYGNNRIRKVDASGMITTVAGTGSGGFYGDGLAATVAWLHSPSEVIVDPAGNMYIADQQNNRIRVVSPSGIINTLAGDGLVGFFGDGGPATAAHLSSPTDVAYDGAGNVYLTDAANNRVRKVDPTGIITTIAGNGTAGYSGDGIPATAAELNYPPRLAVDASGVVYISDWENSRIRKVDLSGMISTIAGTGTPSFSGDGFAATAADLNWPNGVTLDGAGNMYISDFNNSRVRKVQCINVPHVEAITGVSVVCAGATIALSDTVAGGAWSSGSTGVATVGSTGVVTASTAGTATITYSLTNSCGSDTATMPITVQAKPVAAAITGLSPDTICLGKVVSLSDATSGGVWKSSTTSVATVTGTGSVKGMSVGRDTLLYIVTNTCGSDTARLAVGVKICIDEVAGVSARVPMTMTVSPNPGNGQFVVNISSSADEQVQVVVTNSVGQKIKDALVTPNKNVELQLDAPPGVYLLTATTAAERQMVKVMIR